jgi:hypothetical protein
MGVIHRNLSPEAQAAEVDKTKRSESGMIVDPITLGPDATLAEAEAIMARYHISGVPITYKARKAISRRKAWEGSSTWVCSHWRQPPSRASGGRLGPRMCRCLRPRSSSRSKVLTQSVRQLVS